jgi:heat shock protein HslJ
MNPGGDQDVHGCRASAGNHWESRVWQCLHPWEQRVRIMMIAPEKVVCIGITPMDCLQAKFIWNKEWNNLYSVIKGFDFVPWTMYRLLVLETKIENPPADGASIEYSLIRILNKKSAASENSPVFGEWKLTSFNSTDVSTGDFTASITKDRFAIKLCNNISGSYSIKNNIFTSPAMISTMMYCEWLPMTLENAWDLDRATYSLMAVKRMQWSTWPSMYMTIITKKGDSFTFGN